MDFQLHRLPRGHRVGLLCLVLVLFCGLGTGAWHMVLHHENRDARPGFSLDDVRGAYHGIKAKAPLLLALERGHPEDLPANEKAALVEWLSGEQDQIGPGYDDERKGDMAPAEILDRRCLQCHSSEARQGDGIGKKLPLEYLDQIKALAISRDVEPTGEGIVIASLHTHALAMGTLSIVALLLALGTRTPRRLLSPLAALAGLGLLLDLAMWLPARAYGDLVYVLVAGGGMWFLGTGLTLLAVLIDLLRPAPKG